MARPVELEGAFTARPTDSNKYSVGTVAVVGGSRRFPHAPVISALGARAAGAGLVHLAVPDESRAAAGALVPEATVADISPADSIPSADITVVGMGLGRSEPPERAVAYVLSGARMRIVADADALFSLAKWREHGGGPVAVPGQQLILTPHEGEAARLLGRNCGHGVEDRLASAREIARTYGATVVLKGPGTLVVSADGSRVFMNPTGNPFMALGGMGDLLAGAIGARWANLGGDPFKAACAAVWLHGAAADRLVARGVAPTVCAVADEMGAIRVELEAGGLRKGILDENLGISEEKEC